MLHVFHGENEFDSYQAAKKLALQQAKQLGVELTVLDAEDIDVASFQNQLSNIGLFSSTNVLLAKRAFGNRKLLEYFEQELTRNGFANQYLILWEPSKLDKRKKVYKLFIQEGEVTEFSNPKIWELEKWLANELRNYYHGKANSVATELVAYLGEDKWLLHQYLQKIDLYTEATGQAPLVSELTTDNSTGDIWYFLDQLRSGQGAAARLELAKLYRAETSDQYIISMLGRELGILRDLIMQKSIGLEGKLDLHPFVVKKVSQSLHRFTAAKIQKLTEALLRLDLAIKTGMIDPQVAITLYTLSW